MPAPNKKRKIDDTGFIALDNTYTLSELPATAWGHVLDWLWYTDVRSALLICKLVAMEAVKHVSQLTVGRTSELEVRSARRFPNVKIVKLGCIVCNIRITGEGMLDYRCSLDPGAVGRVVPFVACFPKLAEVYHQGYDHSLCAFYSYFPDLCDGPADHSLLYRSMVLAYCGAFEANALPQNLVICGSVVCYDCDPETEADNQHCSLCRRVCATFPLHTLIDMAYGVICTPLIDFVEIIKKRRWSARCLQAAADRVLFDSDEVLEVSTIILTPPNEFIEDFVEAMTKRGAIDPNIICLIPDEQLKMLELLGELGANLSSSDKVRTKQLLHSRHPSGGYILTKSTFDRLSKAGVTLCASDFVIIDEKKEPTLRHINLHDYDSDYCYWYE